MTCYAYRVDCSPDGRNGHQGIKMRKRTYSLAIDRMSKMRPRMFCCLGWERYILIGFYLNHKVVPTKTSLVFF